MKRLLAVLLVAVMVLAGCGSEKVQIEEGAKLRYIGGSLDLDVVIDEMKILKKSNVPSGNPVRYIEVSYTVKNYSGELLDPSAISLDFRSVAELKKEVELLDDPRRSENAKKFLPVISGKTLRKDELVKGKQVIFSSGKGLRLHLNIAGYKWLAELPYTVNE